MASPLLLKISFSLLLTDPGEKTSRVPTLSVQMIESVLLWVFFLITKICPFQSGYYMSDPNGFVSSLFFVCSCIWLVASVLYEVQLVNSGGDVRQPRKSLSLSCKIFGFNFTIYHMHCVFEDLGEEIKWVAEVSKLTEK